MAGDTRMAGKVALLLWAQTLSLAGAQSTQLLVEPPWTPAVLWDRVTLTCQCSGTAGATSWYKDGQRWGQEQRHSFTVTESGTYTCGGPGTGRSSPVTVSDDWLVLQVPARALLEGDTVTLRCRGRQNNSVTRVSFYRDRQELRALHNGIELSLSPLQLHHSGHYHCRGWVKYWGWWEQSAAVPVPVQGDHLTAATPKHSWPFPRDLGSQIPLPYSQTLCLSWHRRVPPNFPRGPPSISAASAPPAPCGPQPPSCTASTGTGSRWAARRGPRSSWCPPWGSPTRGITAARCAPRAGPCRRAAPGSASRCTVSAGWARGAPTAPTGPHLGTSLYPRNLSCVPPRLPCVPSLLFVSSHPSVVDPIHDIFVSYPCVPYPPAPTMDANPSLGLSPVRVPAVPVANATITPGPPALQMCPGDPVTLRCSVQVGSAPVTFTWLHDGQEVGQGPLLELGAVDVGHSGTYQCVATNQLGQDGHRVFQALSPELALEVTPQGTTGHHWITASRKQQERAPTEDGEVLYTHVVSTKQMGVSPCATTLQDPQGCPPCPGDGHEWGIPCGAVQSSPFQCSQLSQYLQGLHIPSSWDTALDLCPTDWTQNSDFELNWKKWFLFVQLCPLSSGWRRVPVRLLSRSLWDLQDFWGSLSPLRKGTK
ncbi:uncharacterized protein LOC130263037 isoform X3 [Oenanthe melanoleuca]|uniref:uncharacterized protein LOC130263037 isoform X3 n=1 Tax=Oenanthe melanoleuca TaxID=2939378 RepID=UPI0024C0F747|nr:uncharacterized protein LOC130263037 isoform X3 [Oenanthe melanoleuca]